MGEGNSSPNNLRTLISGGKKNFSPTGCGGHKIWLRFFRGGAHKIRLRSLFFARSISFQKGRLANLRHALLWAGKHFYNQSVSSIPELTFGWTCARGILVNLFVVLTYKWAPQTSSWIMLDPDFQISRLEGCGPLEKEEEIRPNLGMQRMKCRMGVTMIYHEDSCGSHHPFSSPFLLGLGKLLSMWGPWNFPILFDKSNDNRKQYLPIFLFLLFRFFFFTLF